MIRTTDTKSDELLTREQVAAMLGIESHTLACWRSEGRGPALIKFGRGRSAAVRYRRSAVEAWLADPAQAEAASREGWREERRQALAAKVNRPASVASAGPLKRRRRARTKA